MLGARFSKGRLLLPQPALLPFQQLLVPQNNQMGLWKHLTRQEADLRKPTAIWLSPQVLPVPPLSSTGPAIAVLLWDLTQNHRIIKARKALSDPQVQPNPSHRAYCPRSSVLHPHSSGAPPGMGTPPPPWEAVPLHCSA